MSEISDEMLMAYADGGLDIETRRRIEAYLQTSKAGLARLTPFMVTRRDNLVREFAPLLDRQIPDALIETIFSAPMAAQPQDKSGPALARRVEPESLWSRLAGVFSAPMALGAMATACSVALLIGAGAGWSLKPDVVATGGATDPSALIALSGGQLNAGQDLAKALESSASMKAATVVADGSTLTIMPTLTFVARDQSYCRQYEIGLASGQRFAGLGCREGQNGQAGIWRIEAHAPLTAKSKGADGLGRVAGGKGSPAIEAISNELIDGAALDGDAEAALIKNSWQR